MREILERLFLTIFTEIDFNAVVDEETRQIFFTKGRKTYAITVREIQKGRKEWIEKKDKNSAEI